MGFDDDFAAANDLLAEAFGVTVSIVRGATTVSGITAQATVTEYSGEDRGGFKTTVRSSDFVIAAGDYDFGSGAVEPRTGDRITRDIDSTTVTYQVMETPDGRAAEWADPDGDEWLIHANRISP